MSSFQPALIIVPGREKGGKELALSLHSGVEEKVYSLACGLGLMVPPDLYHNHFRPKSSTVSLKAGVSVS